MRKISFICLLLVFLSFFLFIPAKKAFADEELSAPPIIQEYLAFKVHYTGLEKNNCYVFGLYNINTNQDIPSPKTASASCYKGSKIVYYSTNQFPPEGDFLVEGLAAGDYQLSLDKQECGLGGLSCELKRKTLLRFNVAPAPSPSVSQTPGTTPGTGICNIGFQIPDLGTDCTSCINANFGTISNSSTVISDIKTANPGNFADDCTDQQIINYWCNKQNNPTCLGIKLGQCGSFCTSTTIIIPSTSTLNSPLPPCKEWEGGKCISVDTGLGIPFSTDPAGFIKTLFGVLLSISGGIALLLIIVSGYRLMISQGNPEKVQGAKETLTSAIIGLVFIIFAMAILQIIGVDILRIPGFEK